MPCNVVQRDGVSCRVKSCDLLSCLLMYCNVGAVSRNVVSCLSCNAVCSVASCSVWEVALFVCLLACLITCSLLLGARAMAYVLLVCIGLFCFAL